VRQVFQVWSRSETQVGLDSRSEMMQMDTVVLDALVFVKGLDPGRSYYCTLGDRRLDCRAKICSGALMSARTQNCPGAGLQTHEIKGNLHRSDVD
jgi:hypothetical protein